MSKKVRNAIIRWTSTVLILALVTSGLAYVMHPITNSLGVQNKAIELSNDGQDITDEIKSLVESEVLLENDKLAMLMNSDTSISIMDKSTGKITDTTLRGDIGNYNSECNDFYSMLTLSYLDSNNSVVQLNSSTDAVQSDQFKVLRINENKIRVEYLLGEKGIDKLIPPAIEKKRFEKEIIKKLDKDDADFLKRRYELFSAKTLTDDVEKKEMLEKYPNLKNKDFYILGTASGLVVEKRTREVFTSLGYSSQDYDNDCADSGYLNSEDTLTFHVAMDFSLNDSDLVVSIPHDEIQFYGTYPLLSIDVLKYFLRSDNESGSYLIPSGSGALMNFSTGCTTASYSAPFYGRDNTVVQTVCPELMHDNTERLSFPVYGIDRPGLRVMAMVEGADSSATLYVNRKSGSSYAYTNFMIVQSEKAYITESRELNMCGNTQNTKDILLRYRFLPQSTNDNGYEIMARDYRQYLIQNKILIENELSETPTMLLQNIGQVTDICQALGLINYSGDLKLTTFAQSDEIINELLNHGIDNVRLKLTGWNKNGFLSQAPGNVVFSNALGGKEGWQTLQNKLAKLGITYSTDVSMTYYYHDRLGDGYNTRNNAARFVDKGIAKLWQYDPVSGFVNKKSEYTIINSPRNFAKYAESYSKYKKMLGNSLSIGSLSCTLNSDYNVKNYIDRENAKEHVVKALEILKSKGFSMMAWDANAYALKYLSYLENVPVSSSVNIVLDSYIPFKQMILHGAIEYSTSAVNRVADEDDFVLHAIETGSSLNYSLCAEITEEIMQTDFTELFNDSFANNVEHMVSACKKVTKALDGLNNVPMIGFVKKGNISKITYNNGTIIYVNFGTSDAEVDGYTVLAKDYLRVSA